MYWVRTPPLAPSVKAQLDTIEVYERNQERGYLRTCSGYRRVNKTPELQVPHPRVAHVHAGTRGERNRP